jgi:hypothetical protein
MRDATALVATLAAPAMADNVDLAKGKMHDGDYTTQLLAVKNNMTMLLKSIFAECGFFHDMSWWDQERRGFKMSSQAKRLMVRSIPKTPSSIALTAAFNYRTR